MMKQNATQNNSSNNPLDVDQQARRKFMKTSATLAGGAMLVPQFVYAAEKPKKKLRIGIVGGRFGTSFFWHKHPDCVVAAVSDLRPERRKRLQAVYNCPKAYDSLEELVLDKEIDAVGVFTDAPLHVDHAIKAMNQGKHVISAVPAAMGSLEEAAALKDIVEKTGLTYMMAETSYFQQATISARKFYEEGKFGDLYYCESMYQHDGLDSLFFENGKPTWRHGMPPMWYPTHCTAHLISVTGERLTEVVCHGWGDEAENLKGNPYGDNPFWNESAMFKTNKDHGFQVNVWWKGAHKGGERAEWIGSDMSFYGHHTNGMGPVIVRKGIQQEKDDAGFVRNLPQFEKYKQPNWWSTEMLPKELRFNSGHEGSHTFLTNEFVDAVNNNRRPVIDVYEALAYTVPGIVAHSSALKGGELLKIPQFERPAS